jgi:hypothetical protein
MEVSITRAQDSVHRRPLCQRYDLLMRERLAGIVSITSSMTTLIC